MRPRLMYSAVTIAASLLLIVAVMVASFIPAQASNSKSASITVAASVANNCKISVTQPATITYDPIVANATADQHDSSGAVVVQCTKGDSATVDLDKGLHSATAGSYFTPQMLGGTNGNDLKYIVYQPGAVPGSSPFTAPAAFTTEWGSTDSLDGTTHGSSFAVTGEGPGNNNPITLTLGIDIPQAQNVVADSYTDTMTATVTY